MSDFIYDATGLPTGKTDARTLTGPAAQSITAAEWNLVMQALADVRDGLLNGDYHGFLNAAAAVSAVGGARLRSSGGRLQVSDGGAAYRGVKHPDVNVLDFGADPTGVADSSQAFRNAIASFSAAGDSNGGVIIVPPGIYRIASTVRIKKSVHIKGSAPFVATATCYFKIDPGVTGFVFERYNTPIGTADSASGDGGMISGVGFYNPSHKVAVWTQSTAYSLGAVKKVGPAPHQGAVLLGENQYNHYICTQAGTSASSGTGPKSFGNDKTLNYDGQTNNFVVGQRIYGQTSGADGIVATDTDAGSTGQLRLTSITGAFVDNENLRNSTGSTTYAVSNGTLTAPVADELDGSARWSYLGGGEAIRIRANGCMIRNVSVAGMSGSGIIITGGDLECPGAFANSNGWQMRGVTITTCDGHGLYVNGSDSNGGLWVGGAIGGNGGPASDGVFTGPGFNIYDSSFLGNTYEGIEFYTVGGQGCIFSDSVGGGSTWLGCYQEGNGGGHSIMASGNVVIGGGLSVSDFRSSGAPDWNWPSSISIGPGNSGNGLGQMIRGFNAEDWRASFYYPIGIQRVNNSKLYRVITAGTSASSGGPTGTGSDITDGSVHWAYISSYNAANGYAILGSPDPTIKAVLSWQIPDDVSVALTQSMRYQTAGGVTNGLAFQYGTSGPNPTVDEGNGLGLTHAVNKTIISEWPQKVPAGKAIVDQMWVGGCRVFYGTTLPAEGTFQPGDRMYYKGTACAAGGAEGKVCTTGGTIGTYTGGRTATANGSTTVLISGAAMSTLVDQQDFKVGDKLTINSVTSRVIAVSTDGLTLTMSASVTLGSALAVAFSAPVFKEFGAIAA